MEVKVKKLHPDARLPEFKSDEALCFDFYAVDDGVPHPNDPMATHYRTGLAFEFPPGWGMEVYSRSGDGFILGTRLSNAVGIIDPDYRGELKVSLRFDAATPALRPRKGVRIAQGKLVQRILVTFVEVEELSGTARGVNGFGSTGK